jgi:hypothetical protein
MEQEMAGIEALNEEEPGVSTIFKKATRAVSLRVLMNENSIKNSLFPLILLSFFF